MLVLLAYADWAHEDGSNIFPGIDITAAKSRISVRTARYANDELCESGVLVKVAHHRGGRGNFVEYSIDFERAARIADFARGRKSGLRVVPPEEIGARAECENSRAKDAT